ncbi:PREDICTED: uncharacterized protein LOC109235797 [Nicotiana attenuata]|uniref:uncharacterized protein LOC109235797 n=1 Tax=Nicotiana attenuata TaxID=49451 RepID=UPI0009053D75|nr:PREDICTED: uncharacterized protein LOC109235797 [Nicotiana attenuata]
MGKIEAKEHSDFPVGEMKRFDVTTKNQNQSWKLPVSRFTSIINEQHSLGDVIPRNKLVKKILSVLPGSWESKVNAITEAKDLQTLTMGELIGNLKTYEMKRKEDNERREPKKEKNLEQYKQNPDKAGKRNLVPEKRFNRKSAADNIVKQVLAAWETPQVNPKGNHILVNNKETLTIELGEAEQSRDDLVVCVVDRDETIANLELEKEALNEKITRVENERDDLMVVVVDLKEIIEDLSSKKHSLEEKTASIEEETDDLLVICANLEETSEGPNREHRSVNLEKGKGVASELHILLEKELNVVKTSLCKELERNHQLQIELEKVRTDLEKSLKWTWSSDAVTAMYLNNGGNKQGIGFKREKTPYNPHNKYVTIPDNWLCNHYGNNGHFKENCQARFKSVQKNKPSRIE